MLLARRGLCGGGLGGSGGSLSRRLPLYEMSNAGDWWMWAGLWAGYDETLMITVSCWKKSKVSILCVLQNSCRLHKVVMQQRYVQYFLSGTLSMSDGMAFQYAKHI